MLLRCVRTDSAPVPDVRIVPLETVTAELPAGTTMITPAERAWVLEDRRRAVHERLYRDPPRDVPRRRTRGSAPVRPHRPDDFGTDYYREGLERTVDGLNTEAELNDLGRVIQHATISNAPIQRLKVIDT